jgi:hypothetical protein
MHRVEADIAAGRLWKARDRLEGKLFHAPANQKVLELLGAVRADMGDLPAAGLAWFLTDGDDPRRDAAHDAMRERYGGGPNLAYRLKVRAEIEDFPGAVQERLRALQDETGGRWRPARRAGDEDKPKVSALADLAGMAGCLGIWLLAVGPWVRGVVAFFE